MTGDRSSGEWWGLGAAWITCALVLLSALFVPGLWGLALATVLVSGLATWWLLVPVRDARRTPLRRLGSAIDRLSVDHVAEPVDGVDPTLAELIRRLDRAVESVEAERRDAAERDESLGLLSDGVAAPLLVTDPDGRVLLANLAFRTMLSLGPRSPILRPLESVFPRAEALSLHNAAAGGETARARLRVETPEGVKTFDVTASPLRPRSADLLHLSGRDAAALLTFADVSELATANDLKTDFVANASHELRTPVASIRAVIETLDGPLGSDTETRERIIKMAYANLQRLEELMRDLLDLARLESPDASPKAVNVSLRALADRLAARFEDACREREVGLVFELDDAPDTLRTDPSLVELILANLIDNATKFSTPGQRVRIEATPLLTANPGERGGVVIRVIDRGTGIPLNQQQRVFERFYQIEDARTGVTDRRGTGLGLAIVKHALRSLSGTIRVDSVWQEGTTMTIELPRTIAVGTTPTVDETPDETGDQAGDEVAGADA